MVVRAVVVWVVEDGFVADEDWSCVVFVEEGATE